MTEYQQFLETNAPFFQKWAEIRAAVNESKIDAIVGNVFKIGDGFNSNNFVFVVKAKGTEKQKASHVFTLEVSAKGIETNERRLTDFEMRKPVETLEEVHQCLTELRRRICAIETLDFDEMKRIVGIK